MISLQNALGGSDPIESDLRTKDWFFLDWNLMIGLCIAYVGFVVIGQKLMIQRQKFDLFYLRILHNGLLTAFNFYLVVEILRQAASTGWYTPIVRDDRGLGMAKILYLFYISKMWEFLDTIIMVLRKSNNQISFLHVYHHVSVTMMWWFNMTYYPGGEAWPSAWLNSFVHVWMYSYYFLASMDIQSWWKKYLTQLQISQLSLFVLQGFFIYFQANRNFRFIGVVNSVYALTILILFIDFYVRSYNTKSEKAANAKKKN